MGGNSFFFGTIRDAAPCNVLLEGAEDLGESNIIIRHYFFEAFLFGRLIAMKMNICKLETQGHMLTPVSNNNRHLN